MKPLPGAEVENDDPFDVRPFCPICLKRDKLSRPDSLKPIYNCQRCGVDIRLKKPRP